MKILTELLKDKRLHYIEGTNKKIGEICVIFNN